MDDLIFWLREQIDEDERVAQRCPGGDFSSAEIWSQPGVHDVEAYAPGSLDQFDYLGQMPEAYAKHIAIHDPARVLREVKAKRATVELHHHEQLGPRNDPDDLGCRVCAESYIDGGLQPLGYCETIRLLASVYSDRPGYRPEWSLA